MGIADNLTLKDAQQDAFGNTVDFSEMQRPAIDPVDGLYKTPEFGKLKGQPGYATAKEWADAQMIDQAGNAFSRYFLREYIIPSEEAKRFSAAKKVGADYQQSFEELIGWVNNTYLPNRTPGYTGTLDPKSYPRSVKSSEEFKDKPAPEPLKTMSPVKFNAAGLGGGLPQTTLLGSATGGTTFLG